MKIPKNTVSASQLRTYGTGGFQVDGHEAEQGCPRKYHAKYVQGLKEEGEKPYPLRYGSFIHDVFFKMEEQGMTPDEAIAAAYEPDMPFEMWTEAKEDLDRYMAREASPSDRFGIVANEQKLTMFLYHDEDFGDVYYTGFLDTIGIDLNVPDVLHFSDYKSNRHPPHFEDLLGDVQLRGYHALVAANYEKWTPRRPKIVSHLDVIKFRDIEVAYSDAEIEQWHSWVVAVVRKILRDEEAEPILNPGCGYCFVRDSCPAFNALPALAEKLQEEGSALQDPAQRLEWRDRAHKIKGLLEKAVKSIDDEFKDKASRSPEGIFVVGGEQYTREPKYAKVVNLAQLHDLLGEDFYRAVSASEASIDRAIKHREPSERSTIKNAAIRREVTGTQITRTKKGTF